MNDAELDELITMKVRQELDKHLSQNELNELPPNTPDTFWNWLGNHTKKTKTLYYAILAIPGSTAIFALIMRTIQSKQAELKIPKLEWVILIIVSLQAIVIFILYWLIPHPSDLTEYSLSRIARSLRDESNGETSDIDPKSLEKSQGISIKFSRMWSNAWISWSILYFAWAVIIIVSLISNKDLFTKGETIGTLHKLSWLTSLFNNLSSVFLYMCYRELAFPTKLIKEDQRQPLFSLLTLLGFVAVFDYFLITANSAVSVIPEWVGSFIAGAIIALLIGRLESKLVDPPVIITALLYIYAAIQGSVVLFPRDPSLMLALTSAAFFFKIILFLLIYWLLSSGVLTFYLAEAAILHETTPQKRNSFVKAIQNPEREHSSH